MIPSHAVSALASSYTTALTRNVTPWRHILAARIASESWKPSSLLSRGRREGRVAACTRGPRAKELRESAKTTGTGGITPAFPARWFTAYSELSPVNQTLLSPSSAQRECVIADLAPASGRQDHTASPSAKVAARLSAPSRPPQPASRVVTIAMRPSAIEAG